MGAPWHPHRGFETVTYVIDGVIEHHDSNGGGGVIGEGDTQWMTAGAGILHDEVPTEAFAAATAGRSHGVQLWVNLPAALKFTPPRYQAITGDDLTLLSSADGGALVRLIAGDLAGHAGPGRHPHADHLRPRDSLAPAPSSTVPWNPTFSALAYVLERPGLRRATSAGRSRTTSSWCSAPATRVTVARRRRSRRTRRDLEVLLLGGLPIREPIAHYGPFLMNTREEIVQAIEDFHAGRMGTIPAVDLA